MAKRSVIRKLQGKKGVQKRWNKWEDKREERKAQTKRATKARLAKKTAPQPDTDAEMPQPSEEGPSTSEATAQDNDGRPSSTPTPMTPQEIDVPSVDMLEIDVPFPSTPADDDQQAEPIQKLRFIYRPNSTRADLNSLERWTKLFYAHWQQLRSIDAARYPVRPKLHLLTAHVVPFARSHLWWGLISEQGMEHMHRMCNNLAGNYSHLGSQEKIVEKLVKHTTMLNALHDRGVENNKENEKYPDF
ncbi:hypothetical protein niasHS_005289 [Heterodera schachtii]|uniref:Uncharacterized protein n=1 Tax=Heterodera schachtii TaxID=97005 RepID=A0ABD2J904_HETSC